jgi:hypothetical protein
MVSARPEPLVYVMVVSGAQARRFGMPARLINKARIEPQQWQGQWIKVVGL